MEYTWLKKGECSVAYALIPPLSDDENQKNGHARQHRHALWLLKSMIVELGWWPQELPMDYDEELAILAMESCIDKEEDGKPFFIKPFSGIYFNITHTKDLVACAVSKTYQVGLDAEMCKEIKESVVKRVCSLLELERYQNLEGSLKEEIFFKAWTYKEAVSKYYGAGFRMDFKELDSLNPLPDCMIDVWELDLLNRTYIVTLCGGEG